MLYLHNEGEFMHRYSRNGYLPLPKKSFENIISFSIAVKETLTSHEYQCEVKSNNYDKCFEAESRANCSLPFQDNQKNLSICKNFENGLNAFQSFNRMNSSCKYPCFELRIDYTTDPSKVIYSKMNPNVRVAEEPGYSLQLPGRVKVFSMSEDYDAISLIAEFGGWSGLFVGVSLLMLITQVLGLCNSKLYSNISRYTENFTILVSFCILCYVCYTSASKFFMYNTSTDINLIKDYPNIGLSICTEENLFLNNTYLGGDRQFWLDGNNISTKLYRIFFFNESGNGFPDKFYTFADSENNLAKQVKLLNWIQDDKVQFCQTFELKKNITYMKFTVYKEVFLFLHLNQQFFNSDGKTRLTVIPERSVKETRGQSTHLQYTATDLNLILEESIDTDGVVDFDACVLDNLNETVRKLYNPSNINSLEMTGVDLSDIGAYKEMMKYSLQECMNPFIKINAVFDTEIQSYKKIPFHVNQKEIPIDNLGNEETWETFYLTMPRIALKYKVI